MKSHKHPVSAAAGSSTSLERSNEQYCDMDCKWHDKDKGQDKIVKEVENMNKNVAIKRARAHTMSTPKGMTVVGQASVADLLNPVTPWSIPVQRNDDFTVEADHVVMSTGTPTHQNVYTFIHLQHFIPLLCASVHPPEDATNLALREIS